MTSEHQFFIDEETGLQYEKPPKHLYKYSDPNGARHILNDGTFMFSHPNQVNDPFECLPSSILLKEPLESHVAGEVIVPDEQRMRSYVDFISELFGFTCFTECENSRYFWSRYACDPKSDIYYTGMMFDFTFPANPLLRRVEYTDQQYVFPWPASKQEMVDLVCQKSEDWRHEREWRFLGFVEHTISKPHIGRFSPECLNSVTFGIHCEVSQEEVEKWRRAYPQASFYQSVIDKLDFRFVPVPVS